MRLAMLASGVLVVVVAVCGGAAGGGTTGSSADCASPTLSVSPISAAPGASVRLRGDYFVDGCNDTGDNGQEPEPARPLTGLTVVLRQGDRTWTLAQDVEASGDLGSFETTLDLPDDVRVGPAEVLVPDTGMPVELTVR